MTDIPVTGAVLRWAREYRGLTEEDAAEKLGVSVDDLRTLEAGERLPNLTLFEKLAARYRLPQATLFRKTPPPVKPTPTDFRTLEGRAPSFSFDFRVALSNVQTFVSLFDEIAEDDDEFSEPALPFLRLSEDPADAGERERKRLGGEIDDQLHWKKDEAFRRWRSRLEAQGVLVFQQKFALDDCRGFSVFDSKNAPTIVVNKEDKADVAKIFTLIHEYCHLLTRQPGISDQNRRHPIEAFCNKFAAAFLMPRDLLRQLLPAWPNQPVEWTDEQIGTWAKRLKVSRMALALRLEEVGVAPDGFAEKYKAIAAIAPKEAKGGSYVTKRLSELGSNYTGTILAAMDKGVIDEVRAAEALGLSVDHFDAARDMVARYHELAGP